MGGGMMGGGGSDMAAGAEGGGGMFSSIQSGLVSAFSQGGMSNKSIEEQRKFAGESITKAFDAFGGMQPSASGKPTSTPTAWVNEGSPTPMNAYPGSGVAMPQPYQPIDPTGTLYWWLPQGQMG